MRFCIHDLASDVNWPVSRAKFVSATVTRVLQENLQFELYSLINLRVKYNFLSTG